MKWTTITKTAGTFAGENLWESPWKNLRKQSNEIFFLFTYEEIAIEDVLLLSLNYKAVFRYDNLMRVSLPTVKHS